MKNIGLYYASHAVFVPPFLSRLTCGRAPAKGSNAVVTRNRRISKDYLREVEHP